jgi:hypothetical protein
MAFRVKPMADSWVNAFSLSVWKQLSESISTAEQKSAVVRCFDITCGLPARKLAE